MDTSIATQPQQFDYTGLPAETAALAQLAAERIKLRLRRTAEDVVLIGRELAAQKAALPHGQFGAWLAAEFDMAESTALRMMRVAERFGDQIRQIDGFAPSLLYALAAPSTPDAAVEQAIVQAETGERVTLAQVEEWKRRALAAEARQPQVVEKIVEVPVSVVPSDYGQMRDNLEQASAELHDLRRASQGIGEARNKQRRAEERVACLERELARMQPGTARPLTGKDAADASYKRAREAENLLGMISRLWGESMGKLDDQATRAWAGVAEGLDDFARAIEAGTKN